MTADFGVLVGLTMTWFSEEMLISNISIRGFMCTAIKKSWKVSKCMYYVLTKLPINRFQSSLLSVFSKACNDMRVSSGSGCIAARRSTAIFRIHYCLHVEFLRAARHISKAYEKPFNIAWIISDELPSDSDGWNKKTKCVHKNIKTIVS